MNFELINNFNIFLGVGAIALQIFSVLALLILFLGPKKSTYLDFINKHYLQLGFIISLMATFFVLVYSEVVGFLPCYLCWYQRIFIFSMPFLFGVAIWSKDRKVVKYVLPLLLVGFAISVYQNINYYFTPDAYNLPCEASGVSCYQQFVSVFGGYISIPMLALTTFVALITVVLVAHFYKNKD